MQRRPGEVWFLPPQTEDGGDGKSRRHVLLTSCDEGEGGTVAYASTKTTERAFGASSLFVNPSLSRGSGFTKPTHIYPGRLVLAASRDFLRMTGRLVAELPELRSALMLALGIGTGCARRRAETAASWRGKVVRFSSGFREAVGYSFGIVLTEHRYSAWRRYQIIVPMDDLAMSQPVEGDIPITSGTWFRDVSRTMMGVLLSVSEIQSVFHRDEIESWTGATIDDSALAVLEAAIERTFLV